MSNLLNFILTAYIKKKIEHYDNQINHEKLRNHCMTRGSDNRFLQNNKPKIQHLTVGENRPKHNFLLTQLIVSNVGKSCLILS